MMTCKPTRLHAWIPDALGARLWVAIALGVVSIAASLVLVAADGIGGGVRWSHHAGASAAPLLLVAGAIGAATVARPVKARRALMRLVAILAFTAWGMAQLFPDSDAAGPLNDLAILLFVVEAGSVVISEARTRRALPACVVPTGLLMPTYCGNMVGDITEGRS
jgi:hypothetical protein